MQGRASYRIIGEPQRQSYEALLRFCAANSASGSLVDLFPESKAGKAARALFLDGAGSNIKSTESVERWPLGEPQSGTVAKPVTLWRFDLNDEMMCLLARCSNALYAWHTPRLPEDLAFYRQDGSVLLGTVAHEHIGWLNLTFQEAAQVRLCPVELRAER